MYDCVLFVEAFETGQILFAFFEKFQVAADWVSLVFILYNFAIVGAVGILYGKIVPRTLSQGYLICISICICYLLRYFPEWTGWILLVLLALWDLFAVLAPCGPLKALVKMASERQDPIPGLLYTVRLFWLSTWLPGRQRASESALS